MIKPDLTLQFPQIIVQWDEIHFDIAFISTTNYQYLFDIRDMVVERCNRQFGCETIHPTQ